ncbi:MAG: hypothetical protein IJ724_05005 [Muribaculaceae bacterium]|nr:hypothetical protein [Muribaculaceae bacterium]MBR1725998.1 hypothetical protein [Muribaculaceae bacterium]
MIFSPIILDLLTDKCGADLSAPAGAEVLCLDIERVTGQQLGVNTIKRLLGLLDDDRLPRQSTLDIVARYLGFPGWNTLILFANNISDSAFGPSDDQLRTMLMPAGQLIEMTWDPNRRVRMLCLGDGHFRVVSNENSKLRVGDEMVIPIVVRNYPLYAHDVMRDGEKLMDYSAGRKRGVQFQLIEQ